jgi:uncharacterized Tic20 family protein
MHGGPPPLFFAPILIFMLLFATMFFDVACVVFAAILTGRGKDFKYPLSIRFVR